MRVIITEHAAELAARATQVIIEQIHKKDNSVLGLATGTTPIILYKSLCHAYKGGEVSFRQVSTFNLDEYYNLPPSHHQSYRYFMDEHLFSNIDILPENTFLPTCMADEDALEQGSKYETLIAERGGIDLQLLGIGANGHIGFNEPGSSLASRTRLKTLTQKTLADNSRLFSEGEYQPDMAMTMGVGTIMDSRQILLIASGVSKAKAIKDMMFGSVSAACPASVLQMHPNVIVIVDKEAAACIDDKEYFDLAESKMQQLSNDR